MHASGYGVVTTSRWDASHPARIDLRRCSGSSRRGPHWAYKTDFQETKTHLGERTKNQGVMYAMCRACMETDRKARDMGDKVKDLNDFGGSDSEKTAYLCKVWLKKDPSQFFYCFTTSGYGAFRMGGVHFRVGYDEVTGKRMEGDGIRIALGHTIVDKDPGGGVRRYEACEDISVEQAKAGEGIKRVKDAPLWKPADLCIGLKCDQCKTFVWTKDMGDPVIILNEKHHPHCPDLARAAIRTSIDVTDKEESMTSRAQYLAKRGGVKPKQKKVE